MPLDLVIEFKRGVYEMALTELARFLPRVNHHNRYLRAGLRGQRHDNDGAQHPMMQVQMEVQLQVEAPVKHALPPEGEAAKR